MALDSIFADTTSKALEKTLDAVGLRHRVIADNLANVETPGFTRSDVTFEDNLRRALASDPSDHDAQLERVGEVEVRTEIDRASPSRPDGNNVSIDKEMSTMIRNTLEYEAVVQLMNIKGAMLKTAITEGRR